MRREILRSSPNLPVDNARAQRLKNKQIACPDVHMSFPDIWAAESNQYGLAETVDYGLVPFRGVIIRDSVRRLARLNQYWIRGGFVLGRGDRVTQVRHSRFPYSRLLRK